MKTTHLIFALLILLVIGAGAYFVLHDTDTDDAEDHAHGPNGEHLDTLPVEPDGGIGDGAQPLDELLATTSEAVATYASETVIGQSVAGTDLVAQHFGTGTREVILITGTHGGDAPNTAALGSELAQHFVSNPDAVPADMRVTIIPTMNPDGLASGSRFNTNGVDLNRNFDCEWAAEGQWRAQGVSGGTAPFSEPEAAAIRDYVAEVTVAGAVVWFAAEGAVYPSACGGTASADSTNLATVFGTAAGYPVSDTFTAYTVTGDMTNWLAAQNVPAISVLLTDRQNTEFSKNIAGITALLTTLAQ